ncbi:MAG: 2Fe-2S iron-sulfur cluster-binding protein [Bacillota bacterium]|nr:2Fe-2S iron-sulfur cluster-binding protein [Bacillota bacterium]
MSNKVLITIDGRKVETENRTMLLSILRDMGFNLPTLCHHPSLTPSGACRLCVVEVTKDSWKGASKIVTSCLYPAEEGLIVKTRSEEVLKTRRTLLELYMAQCPGSEEIRAMARLEGIDTTSFTVGEADNKCVLCGLCTRVCQDCGPGAISTLFRGNDKLVAPNPEGVGDDCTGCRACAYICPTGAIPIEQSNQTMKIWNREFEVPICEVKSDLCRGCGICEEVCPFSVPRASIQIGSETVSFISPTACLGCGICAGACPTGAISQKKTEELTDLENNLFNRNLQGKNIVFACSRSPFPADNSEVIRVSCIGSVDITTILSCLARGADKVALMCRDRLTCPYKDGGDLGENRVKTIQDILGYLDLDPNITSLLTPEPGPDGPQNTWGEYKLYKGLKPQTAIYTTDTIEKTGLDQALALIDWFKLQPEIKTVLPAELASLFEPETAENYDLLYLGNLSELHLLFKDLTDESPVIPIIESALSFLKEKNIPVKPVCSIKEIEESGSGRVITFSTPPKALLDSKYEIVTLNQLAGGNALNQPGFTFALNDTERKELIGALSQENRAKSCSSADEYLQYALLMRSGAWLKTLSPKPVFFKPEYTISKGPEIKKLPDLYRIKDHPILPPLSKADISFTFNEQQVMARKNEVITSALYASGIHVFGHHQSDGGAQGIYCVNGQCSQCMVIADGKPVKGCMTPVREGMVVKSVDGLPVLSDLPPSEIVIPDTAEIDTDVLIIGGGPAGISAAIELGTVGIDTLIIDDKQELGGKLSLQTHNFFGSVADCYAGSRGMHIGKILVGNLNKLPTVKIWLNSTVIGVFSDGKFGVSCNGVYRLVSAKNALFSTGAREKSLAFPGADLPGVYGAGAFQTLVNRDLIRCAERLFIIGGGNVGLIGAYHALQAGIDVVGLVEALPHCGGYKVHEDKIRRFGVPVWTSHTVLRIEGEEKVERVITAALDDNFKPVPGTERSFEVDTVLIAVGLSPVNELLEKAKEYGIEAYAAGDANEIAEASAAIFSGKIIGRRIAQAMGVDLPVPSDWEAFGETLKHHAGDSDPFIPEERKDTVYPLIRCMQEIPCNPCTEACPKNCITMNDSILSLPEFGGECIGCGRCVLACPGLAINLVIDDYDPEMKKALLIMPFEFVNDLIPIGQEVTTTDMEGNIVGRGRVIAYKDRKAQNSRRLLMLEVPYEERLEVAGFRVREIDPGQPLEAPLTDAEDPIVCRCERVRKSEIVRAIKDGVRDLNQLKALLRTGLGGCNGKTCTDLILRIYREEGIPLTELTMPTHRPLVAEVHLGDFIAKDRGGMK